MVLCRNIGAEETICSAIADVSIDEWYPDDNLNYKSRLIIATNKNTHHGIARGLMLFDIPEDLTPVDIKTARLYLSACSHCGNAPGGEVRFFALNEPFDETTDTWNSLNGGDWDGSVYAQGFFPSDNTWNQAQDGQPPPDAEGINITALLQSNLEKVRANGIMMRFLDEHQNPCTHYNIASRETDDPLDFAPVMVFSDEDSLCPAEVMFTGEAELLKLLRQFRDQVARKRPEALRYIRLYYYHAEELVRIFGENPSLQQNARAMLESCLTEFEAMVDSGELVVSPELHKAVKDMAANLMDQASPRLRQDIITYEELPGLFVSERNAAAYKQTQQ